MPGNSGAGHRAIGRYRSIKWNREGETREGGRRRGAPRRDQTWPGPSRRGIVCFSFRAKGVENWDSPFSLSSPSRHRTHTYANWLFSFFDATLTEPNESEQNRRIGLQVSSTPDPPSSSSSPGIPKSFDIGCIDSGEGRHWRCCVSLSLFLVDYQVCPRTYFSETDS